MNTPAKKPVQLPWLDRGRVKSIRYRGLGYKLALGMFVPSFVSLGAVGIGAAAAILPPLLGDGIDVNLIQNRIGRVLADYFAFFAFVWVYTRFGLERAKPPPERVTRSSWQPLTAPARSRTDRPRPARIP